MSWGWGQGWGRGPAGIAWHSCLGTLLGLSRGSPGQPGTRLLGAAAQLPPAASSLAHRFVSDYAFAGYKPVCQRKLMQAMARSQLGAAAARAYPPSLLEWTANRRQASMALNLHCFNGAGQRRAGDMVAVRIGPT